MQLSNDDLVNYTTKMVALIKDGVAPNDAMKQALAQIANGNKIIIEFEITTTNPNTQQVIDVAARVMELAFLDSARISRTEIHPV